MPRLDGVVEHGRRGDHRGEADAQRRLLPLRVAAEAGGEQRLVELDLLDLVLALGVAAQQADAGEPVPAVGDRDEAGERVHVLEPRRLAVGDEHPRRRGRVRRRHGDQLEVLRPVVVQHEQQVLAVQHRVLDRVLDALAARPHETEPVLRMLRVEQPGLARDLRADPDLEVAAAAGHADADPVALVLLREDLLVLSGGAELVPPDGVRPPRVVAGRVVDRQPVGREEGAGHRALDHVGEALAGREVLHEQRVPLVALGVDGPQHPRAVEGDVEAAERVEVVAVGLDVVVEEQLLARHVGLELRRRPVVGAGDRGAEVPGVLEALLRAAVVPPVALAGGDGEVGLLRARLDLVEDRLPQRLEVRRGARPCRRSPP